LDVFISLYSDWPTQAIEKAVEAINIEWTASEGSHPGFLSIFYHGRLRAVLLLSTICLLACTRRVQNTFKSFLLIFGSYFGATFGLTEIADPLTKDYPAQAVDVVVAIYWVVLALGFPAFVGWDVKKAFNLGKSKSPKARFLPRQRLHSGDSSA